MTRVLRRCWIRGHELIRELDRDGVWAFVCPRCGYRTPIVARTADERDAMLRRFPRPMPGREGSDDAT